MIGVFGKFKSSYRDMLMGVIGIGFFNDLAGFYGCHRLVLSPLCGAGASCSRPKLQIPKLSQDHEIFEEEAEADDDVAAMIFRAETRQ